MTPEIPQAPDQAQEIARSLQSIDVMSGYIAGMAGKEAVNIALSNGRVNPSAEDMVAANDYGNRLGDTDPVTPAEEAMFDAAGQLAANGVELRVSEVNLTPDYKIGDQSNDLVVGFLLGYLAQSPTLIRAQREKILSLGPEDTRPRGEGMSRIMTNVKRCLLEIPEGQILNPALLATIPREFGLREAITRLSGETPEEKKRILSILQGEEAQISEPFEPVQETLDEDTTDDNESTVQKPDVFGDPAGEVPQVEIEEVAEEIGEEAVEQVVEEPAIEEPSPDIELNTIEEPENAELSSSDIQDIFSDPEKLSAAMQDKDMDPKLKQEIQGVIVAWQELQHSKGAEKLWKEMILPNLDKLESVGLEEQAKRIQRLQQIVEDVEKSYRKIANMASDRYVQIEEFAHVLRGHPFSEEPIHEIETKYREIAQDESVSRSLRALGLDTDDADMLVSRLARKITGHIDPEDAIKLIEELQTMGSVKERKDIARITDGFHGQITFRQWKTLVYNVEGLMHMGKKGVNELQDGPAMYSVRSLRVAFEDFNYNRRNVVRDPDLSYNVVRQASRLQQELADPLRKFKLTKNEISWLGAR